MWVCLFQGCRTVTGGAIKAATTVMILLIPRMSPARCSGERKQGTHLHLCPCFPTALESNQGSLVTNGHTKSPSQYHSDLSVEPAVKLAALQPQLTHLNPPARRGRARRLRPSLPAMCSSPTTPC